MWRRGAQAKTPSGASQKNTRLSVIETLEKALEETMAKSKGRATEKNQGDLAPKQAKALVTDSTKNSGSCSNREGGEEM